MGRLFSSLRVRLIVLVLLSALPALGLALYTGLEQRRQAASAAQESALRLARLTANTQETLVDNTRPLLSTLAKLPEVYPGDPQTCARTLSDLTVTYPNYSSFSVVGVDGKVLCSSILETSVAGLTELPTFQRVLETHDFVVGDYTFSPLSERPFISFGYPVRSSAGEVEAVILALLSLDWMNQMAPRLGLPEQAALLMTDGSGTILARYPDPDQWIGQTLPEMPLIREILGSGQEDLAETRGLDGINRLYAFTRLAGATESAYVSIGIPTTAAYAQADRELMRNLSALGFVTLLALILAWFTSDLFILRQIRALLGATTRLSAGDLSARSGLSYGTGELPQLARAFDEMANNLEKRELEVRTAEAKYRSLVEQIPAVTYTSGVDGARGIHYVSPQIEALLGFSVEEWVANGKVWRDQLHPEDCARVVSELEQARLSGEPFLAEYRIYSRSGKPVWVRDEAFLIKDEQGKPLFLQGIMIDISDIKRGEALIQDYALQLERSNRELQDFAYIASHDMQEPLRKIQAFGERLERKYGERLDEDGRDYLTRMRSSAARMQNLINDLLTYSRVTTKAKPLDRVDLNQVAAQIVSDLDERIRQTGGQVELNELPVIEADELQMHQLLQNLVANSLKFHRLDIPPQVRVFSRPTVEKANVQILVQDNGIGFDEKYVDRIFQPFQRLHTRDKYEGSGIGLAICRKIVHRHNGRIEVHSTPGEGTTFIITLPVKRPAYV